MITWKCLYYYGGALTIQQWSNVENMPSFSVAKCRLFVVCDCTEMSGTVAAAGISQLQYVDLNSNRNLFIIGISVMFGMALPMWLREHPTAIDSGMSVVLQLCCLCHLMF